MNNSNPLFYFSNFPTLAYKHDLLVISQLEPLSRKLLKACITDIGKKLFSKYLRAFKNEVYASFAPCAIPSLTPNQLKSCLFLMWKYADKQTNTFLYNGQVFTFHRCSMDIRSFSLVYQGAILKATDQLEFNGPLDKSQTLSSVFKHEESIKTQKVKGLVALFHFLNNPQFYGGHACIALDTAAIRHHLGLSFIRRMLVLPHDKDLSSLNYAVVFCRPCPTKPRHGFIDSRTCKSAESIRKIYEQTLEEDAGGELILMQQAHADLSAVWTPESYSIGCGNAGATSGRATTLALPHDELIPKHVKEQAGIQSTPYIEFVSHNDELCPVQLRDGPLPVVMNINWIPNDVVVKNTIDTDAYTLLEYENELKNAPPGTVVFSRGSGLTSHWAAHAFNNNIPFFTGVYPINGKKYKKNTDNMPQSNGNWKEIADYIRYYSKIPLYQVMGINRLGFHQTSTTLCAPSIILAVTMGHLASLCNKHDSRINHIIARAIVVFMGTFISALFGELRHLRSRNVVVGSLVENEPVYTSMPRSFPYNLPPRPQNVDIDRTCVFNDVLNGPLNNYLSSLTSLEVDFMHPLWGTTCSFGGGCWSSAASTLHGLYITVLLFMRCPSLSTWSAMVAAWHVCINEEHNRGRILTKFIGGSVFDMAANFPSGNLLDYHVTKLLLPQFLHTTDSYDGQHLK